MATKGGFVQPSIPKFDGHYDHWCIVMENFLLLKEYWVIIEHGISMVEGGVQPTNVQKKVINGAKLKDLKAMNYLFHAIDQSVLETILNKDSTKNIWDSLKQKNNTSLTCPM